MSKRYNLLKSLNSITVPRPLESDKTKFLLSYTYDKFVEFLFRKHEVYKKSISVYDLFQNFRHQTIELIQHDPQILHQDSLTTLNEVEKDFFIHLRPETYGQLLPTKKYCTNCRRILPIESFSASYGTLDKKKKLCRICDMGRSARAKSKYLDNNLPEMPQLPPELPADLDSLEDLH